MFNRTKGIAFVLLFAVFTALALSGCMPAQGGGIEAGSGDAPAGAGMMSFIPLILIVVVFYFILIRPQNKKNKQVAQMRSAIKRGDRITTIGGFIGKVLRVKEEVITIEVGADKTRLDIMRWGISKIEDADSAAVKEAKSKDRDDEPAEEKPKQKPKKLAAQKKEPEPEDDDYEDEEDPDEDE